MLRQADLKAPFEAREPSRPCANNSAVEPSASGAELMRSLRPSPSRSTAVLRKVEGMNWVWPKAPAQEPLNWLGSMSPC